MKYLIKDNTIAANEVMNNVNKSYSNGVQLLNLLSKTGLQIAKIDSWEKIEDNFTKDYPKATLQFNLQANGIEDEFNAAKDFYLKHSNLMRFNPVTSEEIEEIRESKKIYANDQQLEIIEHFESVRDTLLELQKLGVKVDLNKTYLVSRVLIGDHRETPPLKIEPTALYNMLINLK